MNTEDLRQKLLDEVYAGAFSGLGAMILDEQQIRLADREELCDIARRYGLDSFELEDDGDEEDGVLWKF